MDRRDLFKTIAGVAAAGAGVTATVQVVEASEPVKVVLMLDHKKLAQSILVHLPQHKLNRYLGEG